MSFSHMLILAIIAVIVIPPDKLPEVARQVARFLNDLKNSTGGLWDDLKRDAAFRPEDLLKNNPPKKAQTPPPETTVPVASDGHEEHLEENHPANPQAQNGKKPNE